MKTWHWILIAVLLLGGVATFFIFKKRKSYTQQTKMLGDAQHLPPAVAPPAGAVAGGMTSTAKPMTRSGSNHF